MKKQLTYIAAAFLFAGMVSAQKIDLNAMPNRDLLLPLTLQSQKLFS
jgi:hypothetical protein